MPADDERAPANRPSTWFARSIVCLVLSIGLYRTSETIAEPAFWGHLKLGQDMLRTGPPPATDPYSYVSGGQPWTEWEWLAKASFALLYDGAGPSGLILFKVVSSLVIFGLLYRHL